MRNAPEIRRRLGGALYQVDVVTRLRSSSSTDGHTHPHRRRRSPNPATAHPPSDLIGHFGRHVIPSGLGTEALAVANACNPATPHQHQQRRESPCPRRSQHRKETRGLRSPQQHRLIPATLACDEQRIHHLRTRNPRNRLHRETQWTSARRRPFYDFRVRPRGQKPDEDRAWLQQAVSSRSVGDLHDDVRRPGITDGGACPLVVLVADGALRLRPRSRRRPPDRGLGSRSTILGTSATRRSPSADSAGFRSGSCSSSWLWPGGTLQAVAVCGPPAASAEPRQCLG